MVVLAIFDIHVFRLNITARLGKNIIFTKIQSFVIKFIIIVENVTEALQTLARFSYFARACCLATPP